MSDSYYAPAHRKGHSSSQSLEGGRIWRLPGKDVTHIPLERFLGQSLEQGLSREDELEATNWGLF